MIWNKKNPQTQQDFDFKTRDYCGKEGNYFISFPENSVLFLENSGNSKKFNRLVQLNQAKWKWGLD